MTEIIGKFQEFLKGLEKPIKGFGLNYFSKLFQKNQQKTYKKGKQFKQIGQTFGGITELGLKKKVCLAFYFK